MVIHREPRMGAMVDCSAGETSPGRTAPEDIVAIAERSDPHRIIYSAEVPYGGVVDLGKTRSAVKIHFLARMSIATGIDDASGTDQILSNEIMPSLVATRGCARRCSAIINIEMIGDRPPPFVVAGIHE